MFETCSQTISCEKAKDLLTNHDGQLVDVRSSEEYSQGALPGAVNIPLQNITSASTILDKERPVVLYCVTGTRTRMAKTQLDSLGFTNVHDLGSFQNYLRCD